MGCFRASSISFSAAWVRRYHLPSTFTLLKVKHTVMREVICVAIPPPLSILDAFYTLNDVDYLIQRAVAEQHVPAVVLFSPKHKDIVGVIVAPTTASKKMMPTALILSFTHIPPLTQGLFALPIEVGCFTIDLDGDLRFGAVFVYGKVSFCHNADCGFALFIIEIYPVLGRHVSDKQGKQKCGHHRNLLPEVRVHALTLVAGRFDGVRRGFVVHHRSLRTAQDDPLHSFLELSPLTSYFYLVVDKTDEIQSGHKTSLPPCWAGFFASVGGYGVSTLVADKHRLIFRGSNDPRSHHRAFFTSALDEYGLTDRTLHTTSLPLIK